jgi:hypothetical protein
MSRSYRKTKIFGMTKAESEKKDKRLANRRLRKAISNMDLLETEIVPTIEDVSNVWSFDKDGRQYWHNATKKDMRK